MKVVAIKTAFFDDHMIRLGDEVEIPDDTKGSWFVPVDTEKAGLAKQIRTFNCSTPPTLDSREATTDHLRRHLAELRGSISGKTTTFNEIMRVQPQSFAEHIKAKK